MDPIVVEADKMRIYEVISNLFSNAIKFTKKSSSSNRTDASIDNDNNGGSNITVFTTIKSNQTYNKVNSLVVGRRNEVY